MFNRMTKGLLLLLLIGCHLGSYAGIGGTAQNTEKGQEEALLAAMFSISSHTLYDYVLELCLDKYGGRLTGTPEYDAAAAWVVDLLKKWGLKPGADGGLFYQPFANPYTLVLPGASMTLHLPLGKKGKIDKPYRYELDFIPGSTSASGTATGEVVYVGYGVSAPELKFDEYKGLDVRGKIVLMEREIPVSAGFDPERFKKWRQYSFHQYKVKNAKAHGAAGMLYNYHISNPNCLYQENFILTYIASHVVNDLFEGTGKEHRQVVQKIRKSLKPQSFSLGKQVSLTNVTEHHPEGVSKSVLGMIEGSDPLLKDEVIIFSGHLDHVGRNHALMPGANDNASANAAMLGVARAIAESSIKPKRSILFAFFGAEEQGVKGSEYYVNNPTFPLDKIKAVINADGVGRGTTISGLAGKNYPAIWKYFVEANRKYIHRPLRTSFFSNLARPRLDAAHFMWKNVPTLSFSTFGGPRLPYDTYHKTGDNPGVITPEIMQDFARLVYMAVMEMAGY